jgi:Uma2 family endonuclease
MTQALIHRAFVPGTTGWTVDDIREPQNLRRWSEGRHELVEGVLTTMPPQGLHTVRPLDRLRRLIERHLDASEQSAECLTEVDVQLSPSRIVRPDMILMTADQLSRQRELEEEQHLGVEDYCPIFVWPTLIVESVSPGHQQHDRVTKRTWYAEAGIAQYWLLTAHERSLVCLEPQNGRYLESVAGRDDQTILGPACGGITIPLATLWAK